MHFGDCFIELNGDRLRAGNGRFLRTWRVGANGVLHAETFQDAATGKEWLKAPSEPAAPAPSEYSALAEETRSLNLRAVPNPRSIEAESLTAELTVSGDRWTLRYLLQVFPECGGVRMRLTVERDAAVGGVESQSAAESQPSGIETNPTPPSTHESQEKEVFDTLNLAPLHLRLTQVLLQDQTDHHNELVFEKEWLLHTSEAPLRLSGGLFYVEDVLTNDGLIFLKEAPLPYARPLGTVRAPRIRPKKGSFTFVVHGIDLYVRPLERRFAFLNHEGDANNEGYAFVTLAYAGGEAGRVAAMQQYQRCLRPYAPTRDGMFLSNTWGDRNQDGRIRADFMAEEIEAGARLGVDVIQIDDGWQAGVTSNSVRAAAEGGVWEGFHAHRNDFWSVNPERFPEGLTGLVAAAREAELRFGLWFGPDSADDFAHWRRDADTILEFHRELNIEYFKIDGVKLRTKTGERNLNLFFDAVLEESEGRVVFDLDVTAEVRPGYFALVRTGPLFIENRYSDFRRYWPHQTLRNLWRLAHYVDPVRLRMEFLNNERNMEKYVGDPLAPAAYRPDYLFATVMFSSPLGWFEVSNLPKSYFAEAAPLISIWKHHRATLFSGTILPIGAIPDGVSWTGFVSIAPDGGGVYLLVFREASRSADWEATLPSLPEVTQPVGGIYLGGDGGATLLPGGRLKVTIPESHRFLFVHLRIELP